MSGTNPNGSKQLPDVFKELQQIRNEQILKKQADVSKSIYKKIKEKIDFKSDKNNENIFYENYNEPIKQSLWSRLSNKYLYYFTKVKRYIQNTINTRKMPWIHTTNVSHLSKLRMLNFGVSQSSDNISYIMKISSKTIIITLVISLFLLLSSTVLLANYMLAADVQIGNEKLEIVGGFENNENSVNLMQIISENISVIERKEIITQERNIAYETRYIENSNLPKDEEIIIQEGKEGKEELTVIRAFENDEVIEENIININLIENYVEEIIEIGTSEFLAEYQVHIGDTMYITEDTVLREFIEDESSELCTINNKYDVKLLEVSEEWCRVSFEEHEGYINLSVLTSSYKNPEIAEESRIFKILAKVNFDMKLNAPSGLTLEDFKKVLSGETRDENMIFVSHAEHFYNAEKKYNINGLFLAAVGIHESGWGTSRISLEKKNLFGYGAYDRDPYSFSFSFETYQDGIELLAKVFAKYYLNTNGTEIYDGEIANGAYYNGPTVSGVNIRYASDENWAIKVYTVMEYLYGKL